ncbi:hypothetical protein QCA50_011083 [Cerrena zonata]|uniref:Uncharacterized protein n=1 Tax=Cerrena zonata TaxID=2478898 RepID=A0AAW0G7J2_9APHY
MSESNSDPLITVLDIPSYTASRGLELDHRLQSYCAKTFLLICFSYLQDCHDKYPCNSASGTHRNHLRSARHLHVQVTVLHHDDAGCTPHDETKIPSLFQMLQSSPYIAGYVELFTIH